MDNYEVLALEDIGIFILLGLREVILIVIELGERLFILVIAEPDIYFRVYAGNGIGYLIGVHTEGTQHILSVPLLCES